MSDLSPSADFAPFTAHTPVSFRGVSGRIGGTPVHCLGLIGFDGRYHSFLITDIDLFRIVRGIADQFPGRDFFEGHRRAGCQCDSSDGSLTTNDLPQSPASSDARASSGDAP